MCVTNDKRYINYVIINTVYRRVQWHTKEGIKELYLIWGVIGRDDQYDEVQWYLVRRCCKGHIAYDYNTKADVAEAIVCNEQ